MASKKSKGNPVQGHGEAWENEILQTVYGVYPSSGISYTSIHDVPKELNQRTGKNVSIKCTGSKTVCFGDAARIVETLDKNSPLEVIIVNYKQVGDAKQIQQVDRLDFSSLGTALLGENLEKTKNGIDNLKEMVKTGNPLYKETAKALQKEMASSGSYFTINPKVGNPEKKRAGRVQISISAKNMTRLVKEHPEMVLESAKCSVHGCNLTESLVSGRRTFGTKRKKSSSDSGKGVGKKSNKKITRRNLNKLSLSKDTLSKVEDLLHI
jgi:hypothetical protein